MGKGTVKEIKNKKNNPSHFKSGFICQNKKTNLKTEFWKPNSRFSIFFLFTVLEIIPDWVLELSCRPSSFPNSNKNFDLIINITFKSYMKK